MTDQGQLLQAEIQAKAEALRAAGVLRVLWLGVATGYQIARLQDTPSRWAELVEGYRGQAAGCWRQGRHDEFYFAKGIEIAFGELVKERPLLLRRAASANGILEGRLDDLRG